MEREDHLSECDAKAKEHYEVRLHNAGVVCVCVCAYILNGLVRCHLDQPMLIDLQKEPCLPVHTELTHIPI